MCGVNYVMMRLVMIMVSMLDVCMILVSRKVVNGISSRVMLIMIVDEI